MSSTSVSLEHMRNPSIVKDGKPACCISTGFRYSIRVLLISISMAIFALGIYEVIWDPPTNYLVIVKDSDYTARDGPLMAFGYLDAVDIIVNGGSCTAPSITLSMTTTEENSMIKLARILQNKNDTAVYTDLQNNSYFCGGDSKVMRQYRGDAKKRMNPRYDVFLRGHQTVGILMIIFAFFAFLPSITRDSTEGEPKSESRFSFLIWSRFIRWNTMYIFMAWSIGLLIFLIYRYIDAMKNLNLDRFAWERKRFDFHPIVVLFGVEIAVLSLGLITSFVLWTSDVTFWESKYKMAKENTSSDV